MERIKKDVGGWAGGKGDLEVEFHIIPSFGAVELMVYSTKMNFSNWTS